MIAEGKKICKGCNLEKEVSEFYSHSSTKDKLRSKCKSCNRIYEEGRKDINKEIKRRSHLKRNQDPEYVERRKLYHKNRLRKPVVRKNRNLWVNEYYHKNKEKINKRRAEIRASIANEEWFKEKEKRIYQKHREHKMEYVKNRPKTIGRNQNLRTKYKISLTDYEEMLKQQDYKCAICSTHYSLFKKTLCVDHNHDTGKVRELLCIKCNTGIGMLNEDEQTLLNAIAYLKKHN